MRTRIIPNSAQVLAKHKNIRANFQVNDIENRHLALKSGECDLAILLPEHITPEMSSKKINPDEYIIVGHKSWKTRSVDEMVSSERIIDYDPTDNMTFNYLKAFGLFENCHKDRHFVNNPEALVALIANEVGYSVVTREFYDLCKKDYEISVLNNEEMIINPIYLCWYQRNQMPDYFSDIIQAIN
jgi:DNA-binding transcriptional LysR family regulator